MALSVDHGTSLEVVGSPNTDDSKVCLLGQLVSELASVVDVRSTTPADSSEFFAAWLRLYSVLPRTLEVVCT